MIVGVLVAGSQISEYITIHIYNRKSPIHVVVMVVFVVRVRGKVRVWVSNL